MNIENIEADITGIEGNTSKAQLEECTDFYPLVNVSRPSENSISVMENSIMKFFTLDLLLTKDADRTPTKIDDVPLNFYAENKGKKVEVGRVHLSVAPKDVFSEEEYNKYIEAYKYEIANKPVSSWCIPAFRKAFQKLMNTNLDYLAIDNNTIFTHMVLPNENTLKKKGLTAENYVAFSWESNFSLNPNSISFAYGKIKCNNVKDTPLNILKSAEQFCLENMKQEYGYHIFALSILNGWHVMSLIVKMIDLSNPSYDLLYQFKVRAIGSGHLDSDLEVQTLHTYQFVIANGHIEKNNKLTIWKMQNK